MLLGYPNGKGMGAYSMKTFDSICFPVYLCVYVMRWRGSIVHSFSIVWEVRSLFFSPFIIVSFFSLCFSQSLCMFSHHDKKYLEIIFSTVYVVFELF